MRLPFARFFVTVAPSVSAARARTAAALLGWAALGCVEGFAPPAGTYRFEPPDAYRAAWDSVEACSGLTGDMARVHWYAVPQQTFYVGTTLTYGAWAPPHNIYVAEWAKDASVGFYHTVRHEMLHDLLGGGGEGEPHPPVFETCGLMNA